MMYLENINIENKEDESPVTIADKETEELFETILEKLSQIMGF